MICKFKENKWIETCEKINESQGKNFYHEINKLTKYKVRANIPVIEENNKTYSTDEEKAEVFADFLEKQFQPTANPNFDQNNFQRVSEWNNTYFQVELPEMQEVINEEEYFEILSKQKLTSPGGDSISWKIIKQLDCKIHTHIIKIFEFCLTKRYFPKVWKAGEVIVIPKPNTDHSKTMNYRPITLLPCLGKILEKIVKAKLSAMLENQIPPQQFGFRNKRSTIHPLTILTSNIQTARLNNLNSAVLLLDISRAFDSVWHQGLLFKMKQIGVSDNLIHFTKNYLQQRLLSVKINLHKSRTFTALQGVPQGSPLSPLLYNIYCYDLQTQDAQIITPTKASYSLQFADDTTLIAHDKTLQKTMDSLQLLCNNAQVWLNTWRLQVNPLKCQFIIFYKKQHNLPSITLQNQVIRPKQTVKYLGVYVDNKLNFKQHAQITKQKVKSRASYFKKLSYKKCGIKIKTAATIYKSICRPLLDYGHPIYYTCRHTTKKIIQIAETSALRIISKLRHPNNSLHNPPNNLLYQRFHLTPITERHKYLSTKFAKREEYQQIVGPLLVHRDQNRRSRYKYPERALYEELALLEN